MKKLYRNRTDRKITGLCGGIADYVNVDPNVIRLLALVMILISGVFPGLVAYIVASVIIPEEGVPHA